MIYGVMLVTCDFPGCREEILSDRAMPVRDWLFLDCHFAEAHRMAESQIEPAGWEYHRADPDGPMLIYCPRHKPCAGEKN